MEFCGPHSIVCLVILILGLLGFAMESQEVAGSYREENSVVVIKPFFIINFVYNIYHTYFQWNYFLLYSAYAS